MRNIRHLFDRRSDEALISLDRNGVDRQSAFAGASECIRAPYGAPDAKTRAQEGTGGSVSPSAATPLEHREGAALQEKPSNPPAAHATEKPLKRRRRDNDNPKRKKIAFRVTDEQYAEIARRATLQRLALAHYCSLKIMTDDPVTGLGGRDASLDAAVVELAGLRRQFAGAANNLNQLARGFHLDRPVLPSELREPAQATAVACGEARSIIAEIDRVAMGLAKAKRH